MATRAAILDAAERLLTDRSPDALSTRQVAETASVPIGSVYRYFDNMDDLLRQLFERMNAGTLQTLKAPGPEAHWRERLDVGFLQLRAMHAAHPAYVPLMAHLKREGREEDEVSVMLRTLIHDSAAEMSVQTAQDITRTIVAMLEGVEARLPSLPPARRDATLDQAQIAIAALLSHHLDGVPPADPSATPPAASG